MRIVATCARTLSHKVMVGELDDATELDTMMRSSSSDAGLCALSCGEHELHFEIFVRAPPHHQEPMHILTANEPNHSSASSNTAAYETSSVFATVMLFTLQISYTSHTNISRHPSSGTLLHHRGDSALPG